MTKYFSLFMFYGAHIKVGIVVLLLLDSRIKVIAQECVRTSISNCSSVYVKYETITL